jgi:hypothetical protein
LFDGIALNRVADSFCYFDWEECEKEGDLSYGRVRGTNDHSGSPCLLLYIHTTIERREQLLRTVWYGGIIRMLLALLLSVRRGRLEVEPSSLL